MIVSRRYDLDWLRVIAFFILIYFHTAVFFIPGGLPMIQNEEVSKGLGIFVDISHQFRLALLFFISGVGVAFARRKRSKSAFFAERSKRLLIPLALGVIFIVPPMVYTEKIFLGEFSGSFFDFWPAMFINVLTDGVYPSGNLSWHHFWFIAYLYLFCLMGIPVFGWLEKHNGTDQQGSRLQAIANQFRGHRIYLLITCLLVPEIVLRPFFPGFQDLIHDWANFTHWFIIFTAGFVIANNEHLLDSAEECRTYSLGLAVASIGCLYLLFGTPDPEFDVNDPGVVWQYLVWCCLRMTMIWCCILTCVGYASRYLRFNNPALAYVTEAVYPLFILHLTVITILSYFIVQLEWHLWVKYLVITTATFAIVLSGYHLLIRPFDSMRLLFGVKPKLTLRVPELVTGT